MKKPLIMIVIFVLWGMVSPSAATNGPPSHGHGDQAMQTVQDAKLAGELINQLRSVYTQQELEERTYVGDEFCIACHQWSAITRGVKHRQALRVPYGANSMVPGRGVVADYDENGVDDFMQGLDFNLISSVFDPYKPNAPILSYNTTDDTYWITIGPLTVQVWITQGGTGDWKQRYLTRIPVSDTPSGWAADNYVSPVQFNEATHGYVAYHPEHWWDPATKAPLFGASPSVTDVATQGRSYSKRCIGCHTTGIRDLSQDANGEWIYRAYPAALVNPDYAEQYPDYDRDGIRDIVNVGCEACHGPGSDHILGGGDPDAILAPSELNTADSNAICQQCHVRVKSVPNQTHGWPYRDDTGESWIPGVTEAPLEAFYIDAAGRWPDGKHAKQHHQQWHEFYESSKPTFQFHQVKCVECHSPHKGGEHMIVTQIEEDGVTVPTSNDNNTLCLACHATHGDFEEITVEQVAEYETNLDHIENVVSAHTNHPYAPDRTMGLSRCSTCHMAKMSKSAINYDISSHTFEAVSPEKTLMYQAEGGMPNSCAASCHSRLVNSFDLGLDPDIGTWNEDFDLDLSNALLYYFGPGGEWWNTGDPQSPTSRHLRSAERPTGRPTEGTPRRSRTGVQREEEEPGPGR